MDHGSLGEEAVSRPGSLSDHKHHQHHARHAPDQSLDDCDHVHDTDPLAAHSPQLITIPVNPYAAANLHAYAANARAGDSTDSPDDPVDPDDFYRSYRGVQTAADAASPVKDPMASAVSSPRKTPALRPNANGTTPKQSSIPTAHRNALRAGHRSASNPVDDRLGNSASASANGYGAGGASAPSVKDLKKRFDQPSSSSPSTSAVRKAASRTARDTASSSVNGRSSGTGGGARTTAVRDAGHDSGTRPAAREAQRSKFVTENNPSSNSRSFASRVARPRASPASTSTAPRSKMQRSAAAASESPSSQPIPPRQNGLLFGEILPDENDSVTAGFGIDNVRPRRTSESSLHNPARSLMRTLSDPEVVEPPSPTDWYRTADLSRQQDQEHNASTIPRSHVRAHSDLAPSKLTLTRTNYIAKRHDTSSSMSPASPASPTSRLPIMVKKMSDSSGHDSPLSTRSNSPSTLKYTSTSGRTSRQHVSSVSRAKTPTGHAATQTRTAPSHIPAPSRKPPPASISTQGNNKLNAYVSVPPPKLSPSLRSSRPRQSVATATTAASRMRAAERGSSPLRQSQRPSQKTDESTPRRRKMSIGPIDFAQRRETIKLAYSKSIRESQAREARQAAAEKRKKELAAVARAKAEAEAAAAAALAANAAATAAATVKPTRQGSSTSGQPSENAVENEEAGEEESRAPTNELPILQQPVVDTQLSSEPLKLEIPGSFPSVGAQLDRGEMPLSAISTTTAVTEFDTEEQTEPPRPENSTAAIDNALSVVMPNLAQVPADPQVSERQPTEQPATLSLHRRASYRSPFDDECEDDDSVSIKISLDTSLQSQIPSHPTPTRTSFDSDPVPVPPAEDDEYVPRPYTFSSAKYETTVTILGPESDFKPLHKEVPGTTRPAAGSPQPDVPEVTNSIEASASQDGPMNDVDLEQSRTENEELSRPEDFYVGPRLRDNIAALRDSTFTFSDSGTPVDGQSSPATYQRTPEPSHSLTVPSLLAPANRLSQHSAWTDFSFGSDDVNASHPSSTFRSREFTHDRVSLGMEHSTGDVSACGSSLGELQQSPVVSPRDTSAPPSSPMLPEIPASQPNLGEFGIVQGFTVGRDSQPGRIAPAPERSPPDPPSSINGQDRDSTAYLEESRPSSYLHDHDEQSRPADSVRPSESASQHRLDSLEPSSVSLGDTLVEKPAPPTEEEREEQRRLRQRQLVIRELIDTEDAFVRDMSVVEEIYKGTAEACPRLDSKTIKLIFRNTDEIIAFHTALLVEFKEGASTVYTPKGRRSPLLSPESKDSDSATLNSMVSSVRPDRDDERDRLTSLGPVFCKNIEQLKAVHEVYLRSSDNSSKRLVQIQEDEAVMLWLNECNEVAKELTSAWNLDSLLIKPMQRITKYPDIITHLLKYTPDNHPDRQALVTARTLVMDAIDEINRTKKNFELVGQIVSNRKRKESDVRAGLARAFGKRVDKLQVSGAKTAEDEEYQKLQQQFGDDYLRLQVVLRDVEYYTRNVSTYVHEFLQYLSSMELVMRLQPSRDYAHIESKWVQFNVSMRDIEKIALEKHVRLTFAPPFDANRVTLIEHSSPTFVNTLLNPLSKSSGATATHPWP